jgi:hypothetical protein
MEIKMQDAMTEISKWFDGAEVEVYSTTSDLNENGDVLGVGGELIEFPLKTSQVSVLREMFERGELKAVKVNDGDFCFKMERIAVGIL